jgi:hypothetical protein
MTDDAAAPTPREHGWRRLIPALALFVVLPAFPLLPTMLPIVQTITLLVPAIAACMLVGWWLGGRASLALLWVALAAWVLWRPAGAAPDAFDAFTRGWAVVLAASFGLVCVFAARRAFFGRALGAVALSFVVALVSLGIGHVAPAHLRQTVSTELAARAQSQAAVFRAQVATPEYQTMVARYPGASEFGARLERDLESMPTAVTPIFPALLALESLAALALAWALYHRLSRVRIGDPLGRLREFRFNDQIVWGLIVGVTFTVLPTLSGLRAPGANLLLFFGALYIVRGAGVLVWLLAPGWLGGLVLTLLAPFFLLIYAVAALSFGVGDTWFDWRKRL